MTRTPEFGETTQEWFDAAERRPGTTTVVMSAPAARWLEALVGQGLFVVDPIRGTRLAPGAKEVMLALHQVLAGGKVTTAVAKAGNPEVTARLDAALKEIL